MVNFIQLTDRTFKLVGYTDNDLTLTSVFIAMVTEQNKISIRYICNNMEAMLLNNLDVQVGGASYVLLETVGRLNQFIGNAMLHFGVNIRNEYYESNTSVYCTSYINGLVQDVVDMHYLTQDDILNSLESAATDKALAASVGPVIMASLVGQKTGQQGEIFNDYSLNEAGLNAHAEGGSTKANGEASHAEGKSTVADYLASHAEGYGTKTTNFASHAEGNLTEANGLAAHAEGESTKANGYVSHAEGSSCEANASNSHAEGYSTVADYDASHAEGYNTKANGYASHAEGSNCEASGNYSSAIGSYNKVYGNGSFAAGGSSKVYGVYSASLGQGNNIASTCFNSVALGGWCNISESGSLSGGMYTNVSGQSSIGFGYSNTVSGLAAAAFGQNCKSTAQFTMTSGANCEANHDSSSAYGRSNKTNAANAFVIGKYNQLLSGWGDEPVFELGNGSTNTSRYTSVVMQRSGRIGCAGTWTKSADYAEMFEWQDGNVDNEDRVGYFVTLIEGKICIACSEDEIVGVVSANPSVCADSPISWPKRFLTDKFDRYLTEEYEYEEFDGFEEVDGEQVQKFKTVVGIRNVTNPDYDASQAYELRQTRKEWSPVGLLGKLRIRHDGTLVAGGKCKCNDAGIATSCNTGYHVLSIVDDEVALILLK